MVERSRKDCLAICGRSGIETLKSKLVRDGYMKGLWVLPEYYEPPQPIKYRPKPERPPFNPTPLIDVFLTTQELNAGMQFTVDSVGNVPYATTGVGKFGIELTADLLIGDHAATATGVFTFGNISHWTLSGVAMTATPGQFGEISAYSAGSYGEGGYGGTTSAGFDVGFFMVGIGMTTATGTFIDATAYGVGPYSNNGYGGA